ncbi:MAG TPA: hypothetical protein VK742_06755 [Candidatus Sulfotelmatobacter sp.]|nr:hypothetical protein [Candidatus Sulfotelmatobacter sp.]
MTAPAKPQNSFDLDSGSRPLIWFDLLGFGRIWGIILILVLIVILIFWFDLP